MNVLHSITNSGLSFVDSPSEKRGVYLSNIIGLILTGLSVVLMIGYYFWYGWNTVTATIPIIGILPLCAMLLNHSELEWLRDMLKSW